MSGHDFKKPETELVEKIAKELVQKIVIKSGGLFLEGRKGGKLSIIAQGEAGKDGHAPVKNVDYFDGLAGAAGRNGVDGKTPVKGKDYFDGVDGLAGAAGRDGVDGRDGACGQVPKYEVCKTQKDSKIRFEAADGGWGPWMDLQGKDGKDGYTPVKGKDYFDGKEGKQGQFGQLGPKGDTGPAGIGPSELSYLVNNMTELTKQVQKIQEKLGRIKVPPPKKVDRLKALKEAKKNK